MYGSPTAENKQTMRRDRITVSCEKSKVMETREMDKTLVMGKMLSPGQMSRELDKS
jgi:hypothetical protein